MKRGLQRYTCLRGWMAAKNRRNEKILGSIQDLGLTPQSSGDILM